MAARIPFSHDEVQVRDRYEVASILNDLAIALWFVLGSVLFFFPSTTEAGTWLFLIGSLQLAVRPAIRLRRRVHLRRISPDRHHESGQDF